MTSPSRPIARAARALLAASALACAAAPFGALPGCAAAPPNADAERAAAVITREYAADLIRHLYRWHFDETMLRSVGGHSDVFIFAREIHPPLDPGDRSRFIEVIAPRLSVRILLKQADYTVEETGALVHNATFKIAGVELLDEDSPRPSRGRGYAEIRFDRAEILDDLFRTRADRRFPDAELQRRLGDAFRAAFPAEGNVLDAAPQTLHVAPLSNVSNDLWIYWENQHRLVRFSADADLADEAYWAAAPVSLAVYDLHKDVLVSFAQAPGSNAFVTRDWAGRALFNCVALGQRLVTTPRR